jgi:putative addiction module killer protein
VLDLRTGDHTFVVAGGIDSPYPIRYIAVVDIQETKEYAQWFARLRDQMARARILARIRRLSLGNPGDVRPVGHGVSEMRLDHGPGYRIYFVSRGPDLIILLGGGDKHTQLDDIRAAIDLARSF